MERTSPKEYEHRTGRRQVGTLLRRPGLVIEHLRRSLDLDPIRSWFYFSLARQFQVAQHGVGPSGNYYEFGVGVGKSLVKYVQALRTFARHHQIDPASYRIFGFDTFTGLPPPSDLRDRHPSWEAGKFRRSVGEIESLVRRHGLSPSLAQLRLFPGTFEQSLTPVLRQELAATPPSIVTVDVDYYTSTKLLLEWIRPILASGTLFYFDDVWEFYGSPHYGEPAAIREFNAVGNGTLVPYPNLGSVSLYGCLYVFSKEKFEYSEYVP